MIQAFYWADDQPITKAFMMGVVVFGMFVGWLRTREQHE